MRWLILLTLAACAPGEGTLELLTWGEESATVDLQTDDGWTITLDHWVTTVSNIELGDEKTEERLARDASAYVLDLTVQTVPLPLGEISAAAKRHTFGFTIAPPTADAEVFDGVEDIAEQMRTEGWAHYASGSATDGSQTIDFEFGLDLGGRSTNCDNGDDGTAGVALEEGSVVPAVVTFHVDHLFWTALGTEEADLEFGTLSTLDGGDGFIDNDDLRAVSTIDIGYESAGLVDNLYDFISFSVAQSAHLNGDGLCTVRSL